VTVEVRLPSALFTTERLLPRQVPPSSLPASRRAASTRTHAHDRHPYGSQAYDPRIDETRELAQLTDWAASEQDSCFTWFEPQELEAAASPTPSGIVDGAVVHGALVDDPVLNAIATGDVPSPGMSVRPGVPVPVALPSIPAAPTPVDRPEQTKKPTPTLTRGGLTRRDPGGHLPAFGMDPAVTSDKPAKSRGGLTRRAPGTHLDRSLRGDHASPQLATHSTQTRDPAAERAELDSFVAGVARATDAPSDAPANQ
jgi:hypothetical protein